MEELQDKIREYVKNVPSYSYLNKKGERSKFRYYKYRLANILMEGQLMKMSDWYNELKRLLGIPKEK